MTKMLFSIILVICCLASAITSAVLTSKLLNNNIEENKEDELLTRLAYSQLLIQNLDAENYDLVREALLGNITASIFHTDPENAYKFKYQEACLIHQKIYVYRNEFPESHLQVGELESEVQQILKMWSEIEC
jgi:hypothetical protein